MPASSPAPLGTPWSTPPDTVPLSLNELSRLAPRVHAAWVRGAALAALATYLILPVLGPLDPQRNPLQFYTEFWALACLAVVFWLLSRGRSVAAGTLLIAAITVEFHASLVIDPEFPLIWRLRGRRGALAAGGGVVE